MKSIILDLDGCTADDVWRRHHVQEGVVDFFTRFHAYHSLSGFDSLAHRELFSKDHAILIFTSRPVQYRILTEEWLRRNGICWQKLFMRPICNHSPSVKLKATYLDQINSLQVEHAYDDRADIVAMYKQHEIPATLVRLP